MRQLQYERRVRLHYETELMRSCSWEADDETSAMQHPASTRNETHEFATHMPFLSARTWGRLHSGKLHRTHLTCDSPPPAHFNASLWCV